jgi:sensor c-di-GMP phosphodiesterase-like protein
VQEELFDTGRWHGEGIQRRRDGSQLRVRTSKTLLRNGHGDTIGVIWVNRPVGTNTVTWSANEAARDPALEDAIRFGLTRGEFVVHYQPIVWLESGAFTGVEALVRWRHPDRGLLAPSEFIGLAEMSGSIAELGHAVLEQACGQLAEWRAGGQSLGTSAP